MNRIIIEIVEEADDTIIRCRVLGVYDCEEKALEMYTQLKPIIDNKVIMVPNISIQDIQFIRISNYSSNQLTP